MKMEIRNCATYVRMRVNGTVTIFRSYDSNMPHNWEEAELTVGRVKSAWQGFKDFALRDNVLEVATGLVIATAFTSVVNSLTTNVLLPPLSLLPFMNRNLQEKFVILRRGACYVYLGSSSLIMPISRSQL